MLGVRVIRFMSVPKAVLLAVLVLSALPFFGETAPKRILLIDSQNGEPYASVRNGLMDRLSGAGYDEKSGTLETRLYAMGNSPDFLRRVEASEGSGLYAWDVIVTSGTIATMAAWSSWKDTRLKIVFVAVTDPVGIGVVDALDQPPKSNFTGCAYPVSVEERLRFLMKVMPNARRIGYIWGNMPQSTSYNQWLDTALKKSEFSALTLVSREIPFVSGEFGTRRMIMDAATAAAGMDRDVDVFLVPNDQMGVDPDFAVRLNAKVTKPILGLTREQVAAANGAAFAIYPDSASLGSKGADLIIRYFAGEPFQALYPCQPDFKTAYSAAEMQRFGLTVPVGSGGGIR